MAFDPNDPDTKEAIKAAVQAAVEESEAGLKKKNSELLNELKEARKGKTIDPAEIERLEAKLEEANTKLTDAEKANKTLQRDLEKATKSLETETGVTRSLLVDNGLNDALVKAKVAAPFIPAAKAMLASKVAIKADGDTRVAVVGDKALEAFITEWAASDEGKHFVSAPNNSGTGAQGDGGRPNNGSAKTMTRAAYEELSASDPLAAGRFFREGGKIADAAA